MTAASTDVLPLLRLTGVDDLELLSLLRDVYGPPWIWSKRSIVYPASKDYALQVFTDDVEIRKIIPTAKFTAQELKKLTAAIQSTLVNYTETKMAVGTLFSRPHAVKGTFQHANILQILPAPSAAPRPSEEIAAHPFQIEFPVRFSTSGAVTNRRRRRGIVEWGLILDILLRESIGFIDPLDHRVWVIEGSSGPVDYSVARYLQEGYPEPEGYRAVFTTSSSPLMPILAHKDYYHSYAVASVVANEIAVPDSLSQLISKVNRLSDSDRRRFLRAARWYYISREVWEHSPSAAYHAASVAIEVFNPKKGSPTAHFTQFLNTYDPILPGVSRPKFYVTRSSLTHGSLLLHLDEASWSHGSTTSSKQIEEFGELRQTVRRALVGWLLAQP